MRKDYIAYEPQTAASMSAGGIALPGNKDVDANMGIVRAVGPDVEGIAPGDKVITGKYSGNRIKHDGVDLVIAHDKEIMATIPS